MSKSPFICLSIATYSGDSKEVNDKNEIIKVLNMQSDAWNNYDLDGFMSGYLNSEELTFFGFTGIAQGWQSTKKRFETSYPTKEDFGQLRFELKQISPIEENSYYLMGEYHLTRPIENANGIFTIIMKKINDDWKVIADMAVKAD